MSPVDLNSQDWSLTLADFTSAVLNIPRLQGEDAASVIRELSTALQQQGVVADLLPFYHAVLNREYLCHTVVEPGWAMPHARIKGLSRPHFALGRWDPPCVWLKSGQPVNLVFLFAVPETDARGYLNLISGIARLSKRPELVGQLLEAQEPSEMFNVLAQVRLAGRPAFA